MIDPPKLYRLGIFLLGLSLGLWPSCAGRSAKTLSFGEYSVRLGSDGSVLSIVSPGGTLESAARNGAGRVSCGGRVFPLTSPLRMMPAENGVRFVYNVRDLALEVELTYALKPGNGAVVFSREIALRSDSPLPGDLTVAVPIDPLVLPDATWLPLKNGVGGALGASEAAVYRFAGVVPSGALSLAVPMVTFPPGPLAERSTLVTDPFFSALFKRTAVEWTYPKSVGLENKLERRTISAVFHRGDPDAAMGQFYDVALGDVPAGPDWLHDIAMVDYDYLSAGGKGWFEDIDALAAAIPSADRGKILLALHGWYDFVGRYCFSPGTGELDRQWTAFSNCPNVKKAFPSSIPVAMTMKAMHERIRYATSRGFRVALYFADGMSAGDGLAGIYQPDRVLYWGGWVGPDTKGRTYCQNPLHPAVRSFFISYIKALLREFGGDLDAFVWDETFHVDTGSLGSDAWPGYADRAMMRLVRDLTSEVHAFNRESGRSLAFLASDCIGVKKWVNKPPYALVADGTYQDTHCDPESWSFGIFPNYRNALWSCNWEPVTHFDFTEFGVREYQAAVAISNGYGDDIGFAKMSPEMKKRMIDLFNWRKQTRTRLRWLSKLPVGPGAVVRGDLLKIEDLPLLRAGIQTHQFCTYDRAGDNYDWNYFVLYTEPNGEVVIFDATGPGCLYRQQMNVWRSMGPYKADVKDVRIRYYFDDEEKPRVDMDISLFFSEENPLGIFREPLAMNGGDDFRIMYCPMPFKKRLKIALNREPGGPGSDLMPWTGPSDQVPSPRPHWCHFTYHTYTEDPGFSSWAPGQVSPELAGLWDPQKRGQDPKPADGDIEIAKTFSLPAGQTVRLADIEGAGSITSVKIGLEPLSEETLFNTWIKLTWDGGPAAQAEAPLGAFFGGNRKVLGDSYSALLLGYSPAEMYCYFPMPFWKSAKIEIENRGHQDIASLRAKIRHKPAEARPYVERECGYLYARYHKEFPRTEGHDYTYLDWQGRGHVVGHTTSRYDTSMEEDERTYFDGNLSPQIHGNGFEDDHNMGWGLKNRQHAVFGAIAADGGAGSVYRFFLPDLYYFRSAVKHGHQTYGPRSPVGHESFYQVGNEESVVFFYGKETPDIALSDELDVGNRDSETTHSYRVKGGRKDLAGKYWYDGEYNNVLFATPPVGDDGVSLVGSSEFKVKIDPANQGVRLRRRLDKSVNRQKANIYVDGQRVLERPWYTIDHDRTYRDIRWVDSDFEIPANYTAGKSQIVLKIENANGPERPWNEFRYWIFSYRD